MSDEKTCMNCRSYTRRQTGPNEWAHDCELKQFEFPNAEHCGLYDPCPARWKAPEKTVGMGYVWDREYEGSL